MRRKECEQTKEFGLNVIDDAPFACLAITDDESPALPYSIPLSIVRNHDRLFFHAAKSGRKSNLFKEGSPVRIVFVSQADVPDIFPNMAVMAADLDAEQAGSLLSKVFTTEYKSAIVTGTLHRVPLEHGDHRNAMRLICKKYTPDKMVYFDTAYASGARATAVYRVEIEAITAKQKKVFR